MDEFPQRNFEEFEQPQSKQRHQDIGNELNKQDKLILKDILSQLGNIHSKFDSFNDNL